eukprot:11336451-Alexandrium_andersonii.AAC.1
MAPAQLDPRTGEPHTSAQAPGHHPHLVDRGGILLGHAGGVPQRAHHEAPARCQSGEGEGHCSPAVARGDAEHAGDDPRRLGP